MHIQEPIQFNSTYSLSQDNVHHKTNNTKSGRFNIHTKAIENIIKTNLSSSYDINKTV